MVVAAYTEDLSASLPLSTPRRVHHGPATIQTTSGFMAEQREKATSRQQRFASPKPAPQPQATRIAWTGGKITSNKEAAMAAFIERKRQAGELTPAKEDELRLSLKRPKPEPVVQTDAPPHAVLANRTFALSVCGDGLNRNDLVHLVQRHGGRLSRTVHKKVHFVLATDQAVKRNTQAVRKAELKFGIPLLRCARPRRARRDRAAVGGV